MSMSIHTDMWRYHHNQYDVIMFEEVRKSDSDLPVTLTLHNNTYKYNPCQPLLTPLIIPL